MLKSCCTGRSREPGCRCGRRQIRDWDEAVRAIRDTFPDGLAIIDEFPYLIRADPALPSLLQRALDDQAGGPQIRGTMYPPPVMTSARDAKPFWTERGYAPALVYRHAGCWSAEMSSARDTDDMEIVKRSDGAWRNAFAVPRPT